MIDGDLAPGPGMPSDQEASDRSSGSPDGAARESDRGLSLLRTVVDVGAAVLADVGSGWGGLRGPPLRRPTEAVSAGRAPPKMKRVRRLIRFMQCLRSATSRGGSGHEDPP